MIIKALSVCFLVVSVLAGCSSAAEENSTLVSPDTNSISRLKAFKAARSGIKYIAFYESLSFFEAWQACESYGLELASPTSPADTDELKVLLNGAGAQSHWTYWIAGTDLGRSRSFRWITNGRQIWRPQLYLNWRAGEPNNAGGNEHCVEVYRAHQAEWNDRNCDARQGFVCQLAEAGC